jgi:hypothetical protein
MRGKPHKQPQSTTHDTQQHFLLRALVGSFVVCAALSAQNAKAQELSDQSVQPEIARLQRVAKNTFHDLLAGVVRGIDQGEYEGLGDLSVSVEADIDKLNNRPFNTTVSFGGETDPRWKENPDLVAGFVAGFSASGGFNRIEDARHLRFDLNLTRQSVALTVTTTIVSDKRAAEIERSYAAFLDSYKSTARDEAVVAVLNNMTISASGKQLSMKLEMSRAQAGNLLRKYVSLP